MRTLDELIDRAEPAMPLVREWIASATRPVEVLPPSTARDEVLLAAQVTTRSPMGAIAHEAGGMLIDHGWLRVLGSGHPRLTRTLPGWNAGRGDGFYLVADDAVGGFFAIDGGTLGASPGHVCYLAPDTLAWESLDVGYSAFLQWSLAGDLATFYDWIRWPTWADDVSRLHGDRCFAFYPFLWTVEGRGGVGRRGEVPVDEAWTSAREHRRSLDI